MDNMGTNNPPQEQIINDRLASMYQKISEPPRLLSREAGKPSCCIFRVPQSLLEINGKSYNPHIVSIGPYHRGEPRVKMIEEHKWRYLGTMLSRTEAKGLTLNDLLKALEPLEAEARECYSEIISLSSDDFIEMMVVDGCFMIELFRKFSHLVRFEGDDPLVTMVWIISFLARDFLRLENQMPYFVLQVLFDLTTMPEEKEIGKSLSLVALEFFNNHMQRPDHVVQKLHDLTGMHLLDLLRASVIQPEHQEPKSSKIIPTHTIHCVSKLRRAGIKLNPSKGESFLVINFKRGVIEMPTITIDDFMSSFLLNCVAYEQCHKSSSKHITTYATLLDCLVNTYKDVEYLCDRNIIENCFGNDGEVARLINNLGKDVAFDMDRCYLSKLFNDVHHYYGNSWHVQWASFKYTYFDTPWSFISAFAAFILLILTLVQTFYTVNSYYHK